MGKMADYSKFLLVTDVDGTLLDSSGRFGERTAEAVKMFVQGGGNFTVATGRSLPSVKKVVKNLPVNAPAILFNGAYMEKWEGGIVEKRLLGGSESVWREFFAWVLENHPYVCSEIFTDRGKDVPECQVYSEAKYDDPRLMTDCEIFSHYEFPDALDAPWVKMFFCAEADALKKIVEKAAATPIVSESTYFFSAKNYLEFLAPNASKGDMLKVLSVLPENAGRFTVAAGNFGNDASMLRVADVGVAPMDASREAKEAADIIGPSHDDDLLAYIIEEVLPDM